MSKHILVILCSALSVPFWTTASSAATHPPLEPQGVHALPTCHGTTPQDRGSGRCHQFRSAILPIILEERGSGRVEPDPKKSW